MADELSFLVADPAAQVEETRSDETKPSEVQAVPNEPQQGEGPQRGLDGRFVPKVLDAQQPRENEPTTTPAPAAPNQGEPGHVPISALLDEREKRQTFERELAALKASQASPPATPDQVVERRLRDVTLMASRRFAEKEYGKELLATVHDWAAKKCDADSYFNRQMFATDDPYEAAVQAYNREQIAAKVSPERLAAFEAWEKAQAQAAPSPFAQPPQQATPPRSLVHAPGTGAVGREQIPLGPEKAFEALPFN